MADMTTIKGKIRDTIYPNGTGAITADKHQALLLEMVDDINTNKADVEALTALEQSLTLKADKSEVASQLTKLSEEIDNLPKGDEFDAEGNYPSLRVGTADTAIDLAGRGASVPAEFGFRASGGKSIKDGRAYIKRIKGNSVVWNQKVQLENANKSTSLNGVTITDNGDGSFTIVTEATGATADVTFRMSELGLWNGGHKYCVLGCPAGGSESTYYMRDMQFGTSFLVDYGQGCVLTAPNSKGMRPAIIVKSGTIITTPITFRPRYHDLTQMFQAGNEPTTIEKYNARKPIVADEYAYNEGEVIHCNTESIKSVGDNAWDEEWEEGILVNGNNYFLEDRIRSKNYIKVIGGEEYCYNNSRGNIKDYIIVFYYDENKNYLNQFNVVPSDKFTLPLSAHYIRFYTNLSYGGTYTNDIMITLVHSGWKQDTDAGYQPYWQDTLPLPIINKYFPDGMKKAGSAHDEIRFNKASGKWEAVQRIGEAKLWELNGWVRGSALVFIATIPDMMPSLNINNGIMAEYNLCSSKNGVTMMGNAEDKSYITNGGSVGAAGTLAISDTAYNDVDSFVAHLEEVQAKLYYELAEPIVTELDAEDQNFRDYYQVADFGTEQSQSSVPSAAFSADIIYQFNAVDMIREHELEITELQSIIATMQAQLTSLINGGQ